MRKRPPLLLRSLSHSRRALRSCGTGPTAICTKCGSVEKVTHEIVGGFERNDVSIDLRCAGVFSSAFEPFPIIKLSTANTHATWLLPELDPAVFDHAFGMWDVGLGAPELDYVLVRNSPAGFAVLLPNPRGSAGYGESHARILNGRLGAVDVADVLAILDTAVARQDIDGDNVARLQIMIDWFARWLAVRRPL